MNALVLDASVALAFCLEDERDSFTREQLAQLEQAAIVVPPHWWAEVCNGLLMVEKRKRIKQGEQSQCISLLNELLPSPLEVSATEWDEDIFPLARSHQLTIYDACYLYLALRENYPLLTFDKALRKAARAEQVDVL